MAKGSQMDQAREEALDGIEADVIRIASDHGVEKDVAEQVGAAIANHLCEVLRGQTIYFKTDFLERLAERDRVIFKEFNGHNHRVLAKRHNMSLDGIYKLIRRTLRREIDRRQAKLDLGDLGQSPQPKKRPAAPQ